MALKVPLDAFVRSTPEAVLVIDARGYVVVSNAPAERIFGYSSHELRGRQFEELIPELFGEVQLQQWAEHMVASQVRPMIDGSGLVARRKDGSTFYVELSPTLLNAEEGLHVACIVRNVTESRRLQDLLLQAQKLEILGRLAGGIVHEFNNILTIIPMRVRRRSPTSSEVHGLERNRTIRGSGSVPFE